MERRKFIKVGAGALAALSLCLDHVRVKDVYPSYHLNYPSHLSGPEPLPPTRIYPEMDRATVAMAGVKRGLMGGLDFDSVLAVVREAVEAAGGLSEIEKGQRVMIKPNMVGPVYVPGGGRITTNPDVVRAVIRLVKERGAQPIVGDRGLHMPSIPLMTELTAVISGIASACRKENAELFPWEKSEYVRFFPGKRHFGKGFLMPKILNEVDHFINVPVLKNHESQNAEFTCCLKSFVGVLHPSDRTGYREKAKVDPFHSNNISEKIAEVNLCTAPLMNIVDATSIMVRGGPGDGMTHGDPAYRAAMWSNANIVLASKDRVACDSAALSILKLHGAEDKVDRAYVTKSIWDQVQIYYSAQLGIGQADPGKITIEDIKVPRLDEIKANWM